MRLSTILAAALVAGCALSSVAVAAEGSAPARKRPGTAECVGLIDPFRNKGSKDVKDEAVAEYAPLVKSYWAKGCPAKLYQEEITDPELRSRIEALAPRPRAKKKAG